MIKTQIGSEIPEKQYVNVEELIIYIRDIYMTNQREITKRNLEKSSQILKMNINANQKFVKIPKDESLNQSKISAVKFNDESSKTIQSKGSFQAQGLSKISMYFNMLGCVSQNQQLFRKLKIRISLYEIYELYKNNKTQNITTLIVEYLIESQKLYEFQEYDSFEDKTVEILVQAALILNKLFMSPQNFIKQLNHIEEPFIIESAKQIDNQNYQNELFFILLWKIMSHEEFMYNRWAFRLLENKDIANNYVVNEILKQNLVIFMAKYRFSLDRLFVNNIKYLDCLRQLLPQKNKIRKYFAAQIELVKAIEPSIQSANSKERQSTNSKTDSLKPMIRNPLTENSEIISIFHIEQIFSLYPSQYLLKLNLEKICSIMNEMQQILLEVAVKERLADKNIQNSQNLERNQHLSIEDQEDKKDNFFEKIQRQNSNAFVQTLQRSFQRGNSSDNFPQISNPYCGNSLYSPICETPIGISNKEIVLSELQTLIKQSAQPHTFFSNTEAKLIRSFKLMKESRSSHNIQSKDKLESPEKQKPKEGKDADISMSQIQNLSEYYTGLAELYEIVIKRLINSEMVKEVVGYLEKLLSMAHIQTQKTNQLYIVYPLLVLNIISRELSPENKFLLIKICSHLFKEPIELLNFIKELVGKNTSYDQNYEKQDTLIFKYSLKELNQKLVDYEKISRVYKIQYVPVSNESESKTPKEKQKQEEKNKIAVQTKRKLKKKLTIKIDEVEEESQNLFQAFHTKKPPSSPAQHFKQIQYLKRPFSYENPIISVHSINTIVSDEQKMKFVEHIWKMFETLNKEKQLFSKDFEFMIMNVMLLQEPYTIVKYLETKLKGWYFSGREQEIYGESSSNTHVSSTMLKFKPLLSYFNEMIKEPIINPLGLLQFGKRMFYMLYSTIVQRSSIEYQIRQYYDIPLSEILPCDQFPEDSPISEVYTAKFRQSIEAFSKKIKQLKKKMSSSGKFFPTYSHLEVNHFLNVNQPGQGNKQNFSIVQMSPKKSSIASKQNEELLELSYNNIDDSGLENSEIPFLTLNPSKISQNSKIEENFDPSKQRELVSSRGQKRFSAMLSNNSYVSLKNKLSPKSMKISRVPSITVSGSGSKIVKKKNQKFFKSGKQRILSSKKTKKSFESMIKCPQSGEEEISYEEENVIFEEDFQTSRQFSQNDQNENTGIIQPPKLKNALQFQLNSSTEEVKIIEKSRNLVTKNLNPKKQENEDLIWSQRQLQPQRNKLNNQESSDPKEIQIDELYTPQFKSNRQKIIDEAKLPFRGLDESEKSNENIISSKTIKNSSHIIMQEDESAQMEFKHLSGCEFIPENVQLEQSNHSILSVNSRSVSTQKINNQKIEEKKSSVPQLTNIGPTIQNKSSLQSIVVISKTSSNQSPAKRQLKKSNESQKNQLSNELRKLEKSLENESSPTVKPFKVLAKQQKKQNFVKFQRKKEKIETKQVKISEPIIPEKEKDFHSAKVTKPNIRKNLTLQILPESEPTQSHHKKVSSQASHMIPKLLLSPRHIPKSDPAKQSQLQKRIKNELIKNGIQMFLLTELEDIYEKFREYWDKCQDMIQASSPRNQFNENKSRKSSTLWEMQTGSVVSKNKKQSIGAESIPFSHDEISLQFSHSQHSYLHDHEQIELLSNYDHTVHNEPETLFTKEELYNLIISMLEQKLKDKKQIVDTEIVLQEIKDKLFYNICMTRLVEWYTSEINVNAIAKIIDLVFKKKIYLTDYFYEVVSTKEVQRLQKLIEEINEEGENKNVKTDLKVNSESNVNDSRKNKSNEKGNSSKVIQSTKTNKFSSVSMKTLSPRAHSMNKNTVHFTQTPQKVLQRALTSQITKVETLLQKIPLNILQYRKKELMLKLKPGKQMGRKYLLDILVKVFEKKKDKKLGEEVYLRLKNIIDKDIK